MAQVNIPIRTITIILVAISAWAFFKKPHKDSYDISNEAKLQAIRDKYESPPKDDTAPTKGPGSRATLHGGAAAFTPVAPLYENFRELGTLSAAGDTYGISQMIRDGRIFLAKNGEECLVLEVGLFSRRIRVTSGANSGRDGWVDAERVR